MRYKNAPNDGCFCYQLKNDEQIHNVRYQTTNDYYGSKKSQVCFCKIIVMTFLLPQIIIQEILLH